MMKNVYGNLYVGNQLDYEIGNFNPDEWSILLCAKEPWHRETLGYSGRSADKNDPEYLKARRDNKMILNLVDAPKSIFFSRDLISDGLEFISEELSKGKKVGVFCNKGESRSASLVLLYLINHIIIDEDTLEDCEAEFMKVYPEYNPGTGIRDFVKENWDYYNTPF